MIFLNSYVIKFGGILYLCSILVPPPIDLLTSSLFILIFFS